MLSLDEQIEEGLSDYNVGSFKVQFQQGFIRRIYWHQHLICTGIYAAVRDANWDTLPYEIRNLEEAILDNTFKISFNVIFNKANILFTSKIVIIASETGRLQINFDGYANTTFKKNRIGLCVHLPIESCKNKQCKVWHNGGSVSVGTFPKYIAPEQPFKNIQQIHWGNEYGLDLKLLFEGDVFEMEDQRNWTDTSYKIYGTPLAEPFPVEIPAGTIVHQSIQMQCDGNHNLKSSSDYKALSNPKPMRIGLGLGSYPFQAYSLTQLQALKALNVHHLRADLYLFDPNWPSSLNGYHALVDAIKSKLELVVHVTPSTESSWFLLVQRLLELETPLYSITWLNFRAHDLDLKSVQQFLPLLRRSFQNTLLGTGTDANFAEFNRSKKFVDGFEFISFSINPQVHATDNLTLFENITAQAEVIETARKLIPNKRIHISPITLKRRFNAVATNIQLLHQPEYDMRQSTTLIESWTDKSISVLQQAGADSATYFETIGPGGIMDLESYPVYNTFKKHLSTFAPMY